jgi:tetratricopeptide (TPR) repeat protein
MVRLFCVSSLLGVLVGCHLPLSHDPTFVVQHAMAQAGDDNEIASGPDPARHADSLSIAIDCLARGDDAAAAIHLGKHVAEHPDQPVYRAQLGELLARLERLAEAQGHFEAAAAQSQNTAASQNRLIHYHTRLMDIARARDDAYGEHLHRGIGLYLVASRLAEASKADDVEQLLCKSAASLKRAQELRPDDARPAWYLYRVWTRLDQPRPAERALRKAIAAAPLSDLTPAEARELTLSGRSATVAR